MPPGHAVYAIGDIHGRADLLDVLLDRISSDAARHPADETRTLVFLGDYIDRGTASRGVVDRLLSDPLPGFATIRLLGNHEEALLDFVEGLAGAMDWLGYGGLETLLSYGVPLRALPNDPDRVRELRSALVAALPPEHLAFYRSLLLSHASGDYVFVHAGVRPGVAFEDQHRADLLWIRDEFLAARDPLPGKVVVHGHTICDLPQDRGHRVNVDTGAFVSGRLTCLVLRGRQRAFLGTLDT